ncbi:hypothetical protein PCURB6_17780 [Paenibacillus curdlanolyticus]|nr:hypothetical protein PCURB6_17780 [Paenibacillus curdlanolyticus]
MLLERKGQLSQPSKRNWCDPNSAAPAQLHISVLLYARAEAVQEMGYHVRTQPLELVFSHSLSSQQNETSKLVRECRGLSISEEIIDPSQRLCERKAIETEFPECLNLSRSP